MSTFDDVKNLKKEIEKLVLEKVKLEGEIKQLKEEWNTLVTEGKLSLNITLEELYNKYKELKLKREKIENEFLENYPEVKL
jgi:chromosome segregation ATPase